MLAPAVILTAAAAPALPRCGLKNDIWWTRKAICPARARKNATTIDQKATVRRAWGLVHSCIWAAYLIDLPDPAAVEAGGVSPSGN